MGNWHRYMPCLTNPHSSAWAKLHARWPSVRFIRQTHVRCVRAVESPVREQRWPEPGRAPCNLVLAAGSRFDGALLCSGGPVEPSLPCCPGAAFTSARFCCQMSHLMTPKNQKYCHLQWLPFMHERCACRIQRQAGLSRRPSEINQLMETDPDRAWHHVDKTVVNNPQGNNHVEHQTQTSATVTWLEQVVRLNMPLSGIPPPPLPLAGSIAADETA